MALKMTGRSQITTVLVLTSVLVFCASSRSLSSQQPDDADKHKQSGEKPPLTVPNRPASSLYSGEQGEQRSEIKFAPSTRIVTAKVHVEDPNGYFLPNLRRENFAVYEDGVRQKNVTVEIERSPATIAMMLEFGGRYHELNQTLAREVPEIGRQFLEVIGRDDKIAIFKYNSKLETLVDFGDGQQPLDKIFETLKKPEPSEANFYDSLLDVLGRMRPVSERKAIIVVTSGVDTFSKANFAQVLDAARNSAVPIYVISLSHLMELEAMTYGSTAPFARIDWRAAEKQLEALAKASGGRTYVVDSEVQIPGIYDDIMENLRVRYVVTYVSSNTSTGGPPRSIRIELIDPATGGPLKIHAAAGKVVPGKVFVQATYSPTAPG
jgi:VWFA-related protein